MLFAEFLKKIGHEKYKIIKKAKPTVSNMKWRAKRNVNDSGIFTMMHMELYMGEPISKWDIGMELESSKQKKQLTRLRIKFVTKILLNEVNVHRDKMIDYALEFENSNPDIEERKMLILNAIKRYNLRICGY